MILFDANVLIHAHAIHSSFHEAAKRLRDQAASGEVEACLTPQVLCEFFAVVTNERLFHPALSPEQAGHQVGVYWTQSRFQKFVPTEGTIPRLLALLTQSPTRGQHIFDAFLVATMLEHNVRVIYTQNTKDFSRFRDIQAVNPFATIPA